MTNIYEAKEVSNTYELDQWSSSEEMNSGDKVPPPELASLKGKKLDFDFNSFPWRNISVREGSSNSSAYFIHITEFSRNTPDITIHAQSPQGPVIGQAHFRMSRSIKCGIGSDDISMQWYVTKRAGLMSRKHQFEFEGKTYTVQRTREAEHGVSGLKTILGAHYKIVDEKSGEAVAIYISDSGPAKRKGSLTLKAGVDQKLEVLAILNILSVREKSKRAARHAAGGGAAASAG